MMSRLKKLSAEELHMKKLMRDRAGLITDLHNARVNNSPHYVGWLANAIEKLDKEINMLKSRNGVSTRL